MSHGAQPPGPPEGVVWDGTGWVAPATGHRWDGAGWVASATPGAVAAVPASTTPTRGLVFGHVLWRSVVVAVIGGAIVAMVMVLGAVLFDPSAEGVGSEDGLGLAFLPVVALAGGGLGLILSVIAAPAIAGLCAWRLVPYPGRRTTRLLPRLIAIVIVVAWVGLLFGADADSTADVIYGLVVLVGCLLGAWFGGGWLTGWYVRRVEGTV